jgi:hypothetical protein
MENSPAVSSGPSALTPLHGGSWRPRLQRHWLGSRNARRVLVTLAGAALVGLLTYLLFAPFWHPRTHLVVLAPNDLLTIEAPPTQFAFAQEASWDRLNPVLAGRGTERAVHLPLEQLVSARGSFEQLLQDSSSSSTSVLIVAVAGQALEQNGQPLLLVRNRDLESPPPARLAIRDLLTSIQQSTGPTKLVILDLGDMSTAVPGSSANRVPELIERAVQATGDRSLWVMLSHGTSQQSQVSSLLGQTVFGFFVVRGLEGAADANNDRTIDVRELHEYVSAQVSAWVGQSSAGAAQQTPRLCWGGGDILPSGRAPLLLPVARGQKPPSRTELTDVASGASRRESVSPFASLVLSSETNALSGGSLGRVQSSTASATSRLANPTGAPLPGTLGKVTNFGVRAAEAKKSADAKATRKPGDEPASADDDATQAGTSAAKRAALLLAQGWSLRDELASRSRFDISPVDFAPHLWREFELSLLTAEKMIRSGSPSDAATIAAFLEREILPLQSLYEPRLPQFTEPQTLAERIAAELPRPVALPQEFPSLGAAAGLSHRTNTPLPEALTKCADSLAELLEKSLTRAELEAWAASEPATGFADLREVHLARRLAADPQVDAYLVRQLLAVVRAAEQVAALPAVATPWLRAQMLEADRWTASAEREVFDRVHPDWKSQAEKQLAKAAGRYQQIQQDAALLETITRLRADLVYQASNYVRLFHALGAARPPASIEPTELGDLLTKLRQLSLDLDHPEPARWQAMTETATETARAAMRVEALWQSQRISKELDDEPQTGQAWRWERLLTTPLLDATARVRLIAALPQREAELARRFVPANQWRQPEQPMRDKGIDPNADQLLALLALSDAPSDIADGAKEVLLERLELATFAGPMLADSAKRREGLAQLQSALQAARLIDARDAAAVRWPRIGQLLADADQFQVLELGYERALAARRGARPTEAVYFADLARTYRRLSAQFAGQPVLADPATPPIRVEAPPSGSLMESASIDLAIELASQRSYDVPVWLAIDYDPRSLAIEALDVADVVHLSQTDGLDPASALSEQSPTLTLPPAAKQSLRLRVRRRELPAVPARIVLYVGSREAVARHVIEVDLPTRPRTQLLVQGIPGTWTADASGALLQPFANRVTSYELEATNLANESLTVDVQLFIPRREVGSLPPGGIAPELAQRILARLEAQKPLGVTGSLMVEAHAPPVPLAFSPPKPDEDEQPMPAAVADTAAGTPETAPAPAKDAPVPVDFGLIAAVTDHTLNRVVLVHLPAWPQKPRRFLKATAAYDEKLERVLIHVTPQDAALLPAGGVKIRANFGDALATGAQARTEDVVQGPQYAGLLYGEIPPEQGRVVTVHVDVDDYPRAFTFAVPCFADATNIVEQTDRISLEVVRLPQGIAYQAPAGKIPVELQVDVPPTAVLSGADLLEVGIDERRDRELLGDSVLRLRTDRQAKVFLLPIVAEDLLKLETRVTDWHVDVPVPGLQNAKVNVLAHARVGDQDVFSQPVELLLDGAAPRYELPQLLPSRSVIAGAEVTLSVLMVDEGESGVAKVEMAIDAAGAGKFLETVPPVPAVLNKAGRWEAKLDTKDLAAGTYTILIRATDRVGNESGFLPLKGLTIQAPSEEGDGLTNTVTGSASFGSKPVEGFVVTLAGPAQLPPTKTDAQGNFTIKKVPPGKYKLAVQGVVRNKPSVGEVEVEVPAPPQVVPPVDLQVR